MADNRSMSAASDASTRVRAQLDALGLPYEVIEIDPALAETAQFCERYGFPLETSANTIIVGSKKSPKSYCACVVRADRRLDVNHRVKKLMAAGKLSFAPAEETVELTGMPIGGVTPLALPADLPIYADATLLDCEYVILGGGDRSTKIKIAPEVFERLPGCEVIAELSR